MEPVPTGLELSPDLSVMAFRARRLRDLSCLTSFRGMRADCLRKEGLPSVDYVLRKVRSELSVDK